MKKIFLIILLISGIASSHAQDAKKIEKSIKVFRKDYAKGIKKLEKYMSKEKYPSYNAWETLVSMEYLNYLRLEESFGLVKLDIVNDDGEVDSSLVELNNLFLNFPRKKFINVCRKASLLSESQNADLYLRILELEFDPDTSVSEKAKEYYEEGLEFYKKKDYELAELNFRKAINEEPNYYTATLDLGSTFWQLEKNDSAIVYYSRARDLQPLLIKPRKYLIDVFVEQGLYVRAKKECLESICVYPGSDVKMKYQQILYVENKYMNDNGIIRYFYPNNMKVEDQGDLNGYFSVYRNAKKTISKYCDEDGIIEENGLTDDKYLEVYSWRKMIKEKSEDFASHMKFSVKMEKEGYLDCYVLISLFHFDIYPQVKHFLSFEENREKTKEYIEKYLIEDY